jgi:hypothetical protein
MYLKVFTIPRDRNTNTCLHRDVTRKMGLREEYLMRKMRLCELKKIHGMEGARRCLAVERESRTPLHL